MIKEVIDVDGKGIFDMLTLQDSRWTEMNLQFDALVTEIAANEDDYIYERENADKIGLHAGKCCAKMLEIAKTPQEELFCMINFDIFMGNIMKKIQMNYFIKSIGS